MKNIFKLIVYYFKFVKDKIKFKKRSKSFNEKDPFIYK